MSNNKYPFSSHFNRGDRVVSETNIVRITKTTIIPISLINKSPITRSPAILIPVIKYVR